MNLFYVKWNLDRIGIRDSMYKGVFVKKLYIFIFVLWYSTEILFNTTVKTFMGIRIEVISNAVSWLVFALLMIKIVFFQSYKKKELMIIIAITLPIMIATVLSGNRTLLSTWMFIVAAKNNDFDEIVHIAYRILQIMIPVVIILCMLGFIDDYIMMRGNIQRYSLGFAHPNQLGLRIFQFILCNLYINRNKLGILNYCYVILAILFTIKVPNSQTTYISLIVLFMLLLLYQYMEKQNHLLMKTYVRGLLIGSVLLNIFSIFLSYINVGNNLILSRIDKWMSRRFSWGHRVWQIYGTSLLGQKVYINEEEVRRIGLTGSLYLDNAYVSILLRYGILVFLIFSIFYILLERKMIAQKRYLLVMILFLYALYGVMENGLYMTAHNIFLIAFADLLYRKVSDEELET